MKWMDMDGIQRTATIANVLYQEGDALDNKRWTDWLEFYESDCEYWVPAWRNEEELTEDPTSEVSLIYYASKAGLEDRVWRVKSGLSAASKQLPRTQHQANNVVVSQQEDGVRVRYNWCVNQFDCETRFSHMFYGHAEAELIFRDDMWRYRRKKIIVLNDYIPSVIDYYSL